MLSCTRELPEIVSVPAAPAGPDTVAEMPPAQLEALCYQPGMALLYLSEDVTASLEADASPDAFLTKASAGAFAQVEKLGITRMTRLFPDAGEYEPRTRREGLHRWWVVEFDKNYSLTEAGKALLSVEGVEYVEKSRKVKSTAYPFNDPYWKNDDMWGMNNVDHPGYDVNCVPVWKQYTTGNPNVVVAVVDGGIQLDHPDLKANVAASGHYNYVQGNTSITQHKHGTHVAGTIAAVNNNGTGVTGIAGGDYAAGKKGVKLLSLQVFETRMDGEYSAHSFVTALKEAADRGAVISQNSWGYNFDFNEDGYISGYELDYARQAHENPERSFIQAVDYFNRYAGCDNNGNQKPNSPMKGGVVVFAAGNDNIPYGAPGNYEGCIAVGAIAPNGNRTSFSCYGDWVDICAPGYEINSTCTNNSYQRYSGTSMACPHVSGVAALVASYYGGTDFTAEELRVRLLGGAKAIGATTGNKPIGPLVDALNAIQMNADVEIPQPVDDYTVTRAGHNLRFDFAVNGAFGYTAVAAKTPDALQNLDYLHPSPGVIYVNREAPLQAEPGTPLSILMNGLEADTRYYVTMLAYNFNRQFSDPAPVKSEVTGGNLPPQVDMSAAGGVFQFRHYQQVDIPFVFSDPDGDEFTVEFKTDGRAQLTSTDGSQSILHFRLLCPAVQAPASFQAKITVTDELGARTEQSFQYSVLANVPPVQIQDFPLAVLREVGATLRWELDPYFQDEDGEPLSYRAVSFDTDVADVSILDNHILEIKAVGRGTCKVNVMASDSDAASVLATIQVLVRLSSDGEVFLQTDQFREEGLITVITGEEPQDTRVRIFSSSGSLVYETAGVYSALTPLTLDLSALSPGVYAIEVDYGGQTYTFTLLKR